MQHIERPDNNKTAQDMNWKCIL